MAKRTICLVDPGLSNPNGHHTLIFNELLAQGNEVTVYCHKRFSSESLTPVVTLKPHFTSDFYALMYADSSLEEHNRAVHTLAREYAQCFALEQKQAIENNVNELNVVLHSLGLVHLQALLLAIDLLKSDQASSLNVTFKVGILYAWNEKSNLLYDHVLAELNENAAVTLYTADFELKERLTELDVDADIHPCCAIPSKTLTATPVPSDKRKNQIVAYMGDAKAEKGFTALPASLKNWCEQSPDTEFIVQYTITGESHELRESENSLHELSELYKNVKIISKWLDSESMQELIAKSKAILLNYRLPEYEDKTSGFVWLASLLDTPIIVNEGTWLEREAKRLQAFYATLQDEEMLAGWLTNENHELKRATKTGNSSSEYRERLYQPFTQWVLN